MKKKISLSELIPMDIFVGECPIKIDLVYANANHPQNLFKEAIYHPQVRLWAHKDLAVITLKAARKINKKYNYFLELKDCLRSYDSQHAMQETQIVKAHPEWMEGAYPLLSTPGSKGHPRAMAMDVSVLKQNGAKTYVEVDMGTPFDHMDETSARNYQGFDKEVLENRQMLEDAFVQSAKELNLPMLPLPSEWWDFRFPASYTEQFEPLHDKDLPPQMQMTNRIQNGIPDFDDAHFEALANEILARIDD